MLGHREGRDISQSAAALLLSSFTTADSTGHAPSEANSLFYFIVIFFPQDSAVKLLYYNQIKWRFSSVEGNSQTVKGCVNCAKDKALNVLNKH